MDRIELVQDYMDELIRHHTNDLYIGAAYIHLFSVSQYCALLAMKRNLNVELASIMGLLHDIHSYQENDFYDHAHLGAIEARKVLENMNVFTELEIIMICNAIDHHSDKDIIHDPYDELLKDADVLAHCLFNPNQEISQREMKRFNRLKIELGIGGTV